MIVDNAKCLVAYFSHSGNTRVIAHEIQAHVSGDIFEIIPVDPYPRDYDAVVAKARKELDADSRPTLKTTVENMGLYNVVFVGYPDWWGTVPRPVATFLTTYDFSRKTIVPFSTHEGSGLGRSVTDIEELCPQSTVLDGLAIRGGDVKNAHNEITMWLKEIGSNEKSE
jgi:flavodoxin